MPAKGRIYQTPSTKSQEKIFRKMLAKLKPSTAWADESPVSFDFGLTTDQEARARRLHNESLVVDMVFQHPGGQRIFAEYDPARVHQALADAPLTMEGHARGVMLPYELAMSGESDAVKRWFDLSGVDVGAMQISDFSPGVLEQSIDAYRFMMEKLPWLRVATTVAQMRQGKKDGVHTLYGYSQPVFGLPTDLRRIGVAYEAGLRVLMLTYNRMDYVGTGCTERVDAGLSMYGIEVVKYCNDHGIIVDTSHCGYQTTLDACKFSNGPVIANHTCAAGVYAHARGKSDEIIAAIAATGGLVGVVAVPFFLSSDPNVNVETMLEHVDYIAKKFGWQHVAIGSDWPLQGPTVHLERVLGSMAAELGFRESDNISPTRTMPGWRDYRDFPNVARGLVKRGYSDEQIQGILGENFVRVFEQVCE
jgi:membrane dipeptidase